MLNKDDIIKIFSDTKAMLTGHFLLTSGRHSNQYFQCAQVLQYPRHCETLCKELAGRFKDLGIETVVGPAVGGITVSYEMARILGARSLFTERENGSMILRRGFNVRPGEKVLVVEDVITTGGSVKEVIDLIRNAGAEVVGAGVLVDRSNGQVDLGVPTEALLVTSVVSYNPEECPLCKEGIPVVKPGSRKI
ncbi:orotate phosphoribosyltransferase [Desulfolucanica intricata]|uniref:orotate phosphoribosyltransferase n=1 Tax=Desulfolucanica intricata TaxID=1285191 RepID=UPI00082B9D52|nr:orotate phosphoribosyltransferase [Desulfolucanica intricata]